MSKELYEVKLEAKSETESGVPRAEAVKTVNAVDEDPEGKRITNVLSPYGESIQSGYRTAGNHSADHNREPVLVGGGGGPEEKRVTLDDYEGFNKEKLTYKYGYMERLPQNPTAEQVRICKGIDDVPRLMLPKKMQGYELGSQTGAIGYNGYARKQMQKDGYRETYMLE